MSVWVGALVLCLASLFAQSATAEPGDLASRLRVSGFATLGGSYASRDDVHLMREWGQPDTFEDHWAWKMDSSIGVQVNARLTSRIDAAVQLVLKERAEQSLEQSLELGFIGWRPMPGDSIRVGRLGLDFYLLSDYRNVGYAYLWERPPIEFYGPALPLHFDGIDVSHRLSIAGGDLVFKVFGGWTEPAIDFGDDLGAEKVRVAPLWGGRLSFERGPWRWSAGLGQLTSDGEFEFLTTSGLLPALNNSLVQALWPPASYYAADLSGDARSTTFYALGAAYENSSWQVSGEIGYFSSEYRLLRDTLSGYLSVGRRFGSVTPYLVLAAAAPRDHINPVPPPSDLAVSYAPEVESLYAAIDTIYTTLGTDQRTLSLGMRWDFHDNFALKAQWDHTRTHAYDMWRMDDSFTPSAETELDLFSVSLNWVF